MQGVSPIGAFGVVATLLITTVIAQAFDDAKYPDLSGAWERTGGAAPRFDTSKPRVRYDKDGKSGELSLLVAGRFVVEVDGNKVSMDAMKGTLDKLDLGKLEGMKNVGVK